MASNIFNDSELAFLEDMQAEAMENPAISFFWDPLDDTAESLQVCFPLLA